MPDTELTFTGQQAAAAQTALRKELGLPPEHFQLSAFIGMVSDEIEQLRGAGKSDQDIAALLSKVTGAKISSETIGLFYASPEARGHGHGD